jgi:hypothetical protein
MSRLHIYTVHVNPANPQPYEAAEFVEEGFSLKAFVFPFLWVLYFRLWWHAVGLGAFNLALFLLADNGVSHVTVLIVQLGVHLLVGFHANDWRRWRLRQKGHILTDLVTGDSKLRAELRFFDRYFAGAVSRPLVP